MGAFRGDTKARHVMNMLQLGGVSLLPLIIVAVLGHNVDVDDEVGKLMDEDTLESTDLIQIGHKGGNCRGWCASNRRPWDRKCKWSSCKGCGQCSCLDHCRQDCTIGTKFLDRSCGLTVWGAKFIKDSIQFVGTQTKPKWYLLGGVPYKGVPLTQKTAKIESTISCPCNEGGKPLDAGAAERIILGQIAANGMPAWRMAKKGWVATFLALLPTKSLVAEPASNPSW